MAEENTAEAMEEPEEQPEILEDAAQVADTGEVALDSDAPEDAANDTEDEAEAETHEDADAVKEDQVAETVQVATTAEAPATGGTDMATTDLSLILDIPVTLSMEIGQTRISINELLKLGKDSVIELQRMTDEPLDVLVNGTLVAHGEAVVVGERFGIRLTDVISPQERLSKFT